MKKRLLASIIGAAMAFQSLPAFSAVSAADTAVSPLTAESKGTISIYIDKDGKTKCDDSFELKEGEYFDLDIQADPELFTNGGELRICNYGGHTCLTPDNRIAGHTVRDDYYYIKMVYPPDENWKDGFENILASFSVYVKYNNDIPVSIRGELDRLSELTSVNFPRRKMELLGLMDENTPRLTMDDVTKICESQGEYDDIISALNDVAVCCDVKYLDSLNNCSYWLDDKGNEQITVTADNGQTEVFCTKVYDDGTITDCRKIYPETEEYGETGETDPVYIHYNKVGRENEEEVIGDANRDGMFSLADYVVLKNFLLGNYDMAAPSSERRIKDVNAADMCKDGVLNTYDLCVMKRELLKKGSFISGEVSFTDKALHFMGGLGPKRIITVYNDAESLKNYEIPETISQPDRSFMEEYDDEFFEKNTLIYLRNLQYDLSIMETITGIEKNNSGEYCVKLEVYTPGMMQPVMAIWEHFIVVPKDNIKNVTIEQTDVKETWQ